MNNQMSKAKRYNITGTVTRLQVHKNEKGEMATFRLEQSGGKRKRNLSCVMFGNQLAKFREKLVEGETVKLFGFFERREFQGQDGQNVKYDRYTAIWAGEPKAAKESAEAVAA